MFPRTPRAARRHISTWFIGVAVSAMSPRLVSDAAYCGARVGRKLQLRMVRNGTPPASACNGCQPDCSFRTMRLSFRVVRPLTLASPLLTCVASACGTRSVHRTGRGGVSRLRTVACVQRPGWQIGQDVNIDLFTYTRQCLSCFGSARMFAPRRILVRYEAQHIRRDRRADRSRESQPPHVIPDFSTHRLLFCAVSRFALHGHRGGHLAERSTV